MAAPALAPSGDDHADEEQDMIMARAESPVDQAKAAFDEEAGESLCEKKFFDERAEVAALLRQLVGAQFASPESQVDGAFLKAHESVTQIVRLCVRRPAVR